MPCPICDEEMIIKEIPYYYKNQILLGMFEAEVCESCGDIYFSDDVFEIIERRAKMLNIWGLSIIFSKREVKSAHTGRMPRINAGKLFGDSYPVPQIYYAYASESVI